LQTADCGLRVLTVAPAVTPILGRSSAIRNPQSAILPTHHRSPNVTSPRDAGDRRRRRRVRQRRRKWAVLCQDEVYVRERVPAESVIAVVVHPADTASVVRELVDDFERLEIPLYEVGGKVLWQPSA